ncbi:hypothetical protein IGS68_29000 (plasmid) [Skermanella sp. TT6]|uniref:Uncharacterized protein n=1 Tax=Skermanella cutis TaxID=2775420 RepID=A0ABX7BG50_9PROT|nr:hypothetical protein [Skermanella sp. TT6]QQP93177.1 hypothetical protein IGS68_29000 [Skermanella sp. TT6]
MQDHVRQALADLISLSQTLSGSEQERILETIERFKDFDEQDDYALRLYEALSSEGKYR